MKKTSKYLFPALCVASLTLSAGAFIQANAAPSATAAVAGQPVDLTYAAEKALPTVVHIKAVQNSKVREVDVQNSDPFGDMFDPFGFFGQRQRQSEEAQGADTEARGSRLGRHHLF